MIRMLMTTNLTRTQIIATLNISKATLYYWLSEPRIRHIIEGIEKDNAREISDEIRKRYQERIKVFAPLEGGRRFRRGLFESKHNNQEAVSQTASPARNRDEGYPPLRIEDLPQEIRENLPTKLKEDWQELAPIPTGRCFEPDWPKIRQMLAEHNRKKIAKQEKEQDLKEVESIKG